MKKNQKVTLNSGLNSLIGFARKSRALESGYEAVRRGLEKQKIAFILLDESLAESSYKKVINFARIYNIPVFIVLRGENSSLADSTGYKILGMHHGGLAKGFIDKLRQEN
jgi:ribosomal protein L7Ae-like RNA K-turn-binding protein